MASRSHVSETRKRRPSISRRRLAASSASCHRAGSSLGTCFRAGRYRPIVKSSQPPVTNPESGQGRQSYAGSAVLILAAIATLSDLCERGKAEGVGENTMPFRSRNIARETVAAIAVMAIYILVLLAPLHQSAGLQRDLARLGYASLDSWSICSSLAPQNENGKPPAVAKCAASGIGKNDLAALTPAVIDLGTVQAYTSVRYVQAPVSTEHVWHRSSGQARAPPTA